MFNNEQNPKPKTLGNTMNNIEAKKLDNYLLMRVGNRDTVNEKTLCVEITGDEPEVYVERFRQTHYDYFGDLLSPDAELMQLHERVEEALNS